MFCTARSGTDIVMWDKNKISYRGLVPLVPDVPLISHIPCLRIFGGRVIYRLQFRKPVGSYGGNRRDIRDIRYKVSQDNSISVPPNNSTTKLMGQPGQCADLIGRFS